MKIVALADLRAQQRDTLDATLTIRTADGERVTRRLSDVLRDEWAARLYAVTCRGCGRTTTSETGLCRRCTDYVETAHPREGREWGHMCGDAPGFRG